MHTIATHFATSFPKFSGHAPVFDALDQHSPCMLGRRPQDYGKAYVWSLSSPGYLVLIAVISARVRPSSSAIRPSHSCIMSAILPRCFEMPLLSKSNIWSSNDRLGKKEPCHNNVKVRSIIAWCKNLENLARFKLWGSHCNAAQRVQWGLVWWPVGSTHKCGESVMHCIIYYALFLCNRLRLVINWLWTLLNLR